MFSKYTILFLFCAVLAVQGRSYESSFHVQRADERSLTELVQKAKESIERFRKLVHNTIANVEQFLGEKAAQLKAKAEEVVFATHTAIHQEIEKVKEQIKKIKEEAAIIGVDVKECTIEHELELEAVARGLIEELIKCVTDELKKATDIIKGAIDEIMAIKHELVNLPSELKACISSGNAIQCVTDLIGRIVKDITGVPTMIQDKVNQLMQLINNIEADLKACALNKVMQATKEAGLVGIEVAKCVADKIQNPKFNYYLLN